MKLIENYTNDMRRRQYAEATIRTYKDCFEEFVKFISGDDIRYVKEEKIKEFLLHMVDTRHISSSYQNQLINAIKYYYEKILHNDRKTYYIDRPRRESKLPVILSQDEIRRIFAKCINLKHKAILQIIYSAGLRESEVINLKILDIDRANMVLHIQQAKGNKDRIVPLSGKTLQAIEEYYKSLTIKPTKYLFAGQFTELYSASSIRQFLDKYAQLAGITKNVFPHLLRHCYATHSLEHKVDTSIIQGILGHKNIKTTQRYAHASCKLISEEYTPDQDL